MKSTLERMKEKLLDVVSSKDFFKNLLLGLGISAIILLLSAILMNDLSKDRYGVLYTGLNPEDAGKILSVLQEEHIPYKVEGNGSIILVPKKKIYEVRLKLAAKGLPNSHSVGFEIFDEPKMGATHFQENVNYIRAIEGELARTIKKIDAIKEAKVNIALPQDSIFAREEDESKASVVVSLWPGRDLTKEQVKAIVFLVSHAVPKLKPKNVTVVDNRGRVLSDLIVQKEEEVKDIVDIKRKLKREIEKSVESMLARALGPQKVVVRANVDIETAKINKEDRIIDPNRVAVVSERKIQEKLKGYQRQQLGAPGTPTNVPATISTTNQNLIQDKNKKDLTTNYDVTKSFIKTEQNLFKVKRITVGVLIDGKYKTIEQNGTKKTIFVPRSEDEIQSYEKLIRSAIGYDEKRGDKVTVVSVPFEHTMNEVSSELNEQEKWRQYLIYAIAAFLGFIILGFALYIFKRIKRAQKEEELRQLERLQQIGAASAVEQAAEAAKSLHEKELEGFNLSNEPAYQKIIEIIDENPELVANMISKWMKDEHK